MKSIISFITALIMSLGLGGNQAPEKAEIAENSQFEVNYIDVGQADSALVICDGKAMMIDGGNVADSQLIASYLKDKDIDELEYVVCTHAHEDHVGGLAAALSVVDAEHIYAPKKEADTKAYKNFVKKVQEQNAEIEHPKTGDYVSLGSSTVEFLAPIDEKGKDTNNTSIVLKITYGDTSFLFTGDAEREEEEEILASGADLKSTVLKTGHHGSNTSTSYPFLREVMPQYAIISCGKDNSYGHPHEETLSKFSDAGVEVLRTDESGHIVIKSDGKTLTFVTEK